MTQVTEWTFEYFVDKLRERYDNIQLVSERDYAYIKLKNLTVIVFLNLTDFITVSVVDWYNKKQYPWQCEPIGIMNFHRPYYRSRLVSTTTEESREFAGGHLKFGFTPLPDASPEYAGRIAVLTKKIDMILSILLRTEIEDMI